MTDLHLDGPPVYRLRYLLEYCQAKRITPTLLTRGLADQEALADPLATLPWPDFLHVVANSLQILPKTEFHEAAAQYWLQPMNDHWITLGQSMSTPFDLLIDLIGDAGHLFQDMPVKVTTQHRAKGALHHSGRRGFRPRAKYGAVGVTDCRNQRLRPGGRFKLLPY